MTMRKKIFIVLSLIFILAAAEVYPDKVYLKNGRSIEGIVIKQTQDKIILDIGAGNIT
jgi:hypothetical protein